jgi:hypothetical protein
MYAMMMLMMMMQAKHVCHDDTGQTRGWLSTGFWKKYPMPWTHQHWYIQIYYVDASQAILQPWELCVFPSIYKKVTKLFILQPWELYFFIHLQEGYKTFHPPTWGLCGCLQTPEQKGYVW